MAFTLAIPGPLQKLNNVQVEDDVIIRDFTNLYGCTIGSGSRIGTFVEIQKGVSIGRRCKVQSHSFICEGVSIGDECFIGHGVMFTNDRRPKSVNDDGSLQTEKDWVLEKTLVGKRVSIGTGATILPGLSIGDGALIGAGAVVTSNVAAGTTVVGNPAHPL